MDTLVTESSSKVAQKYHCINCDYYANKKCNFEKHVTSKKHLVTLSDANNGTQKIYACNNCEKTYHSRNGLWVHNKKCIKNTNEKIPEPNNIITTELIMKLITDNKDMKSIIMEQNNTITTLVKNGITNNSHNTTNTNSHNKTFNLQFFLNETCKDAMNIMDFVDSIKLQLSDLENVGKLGYVEGISNIITSNLKALDVTQRPIHCADKKREVVYIKDDNKWEKEDNNKKKIRKAIKRVVFKNQRLIPSFKEAHPDCLKSASKFSDQYNKIIVESMGGSGDNDEEKEDKIIRNISKHVIIDK